MSGGQILGANTRTIYATFEAGTEEGMQLVFLQGERSVRCKVTYLQAGAKGALSGNAEILDDVTTPPAAGTELRFDTSNPTGAALIPIGRDDWGHPVALKLNELFQHLLTAGTTHSGKSELGLRLSEQLLAMQVPQLIIDDQDEFLGLQAHGAVLASESEEVIGALGERKTVVVPLLEESVSDKCATATTLLTRLMREKSRGELAPTLITVDEAEVYAPSNYAGKADADCREAVQNVLKRGTKLGLGCHLISQRPPMLYADARSQCNTGALFRLQDPGSLTCVRHLGLTRYDQRQLGSLEQGRCLLLGRAATKPARIRVDATTVERTKSVDFAAQLGVMA